MPSFAFLDEYHSTDGKITPTPSEYQLVLNSWILLCHVCNLENDVLFDGKLGFFTLMNGSWFGKIYKFWN